MRALALKVELLKEAARFFLDRTSRDVGRRP
jgi:hypothetical protein